MKDSRLLSAISLILCLTGSLAAQAPDRTKHRVMLARPGHDGAALRQAASGAEEREVDGLGPRRGERDLGAIGAQGRCGGVARAIQRSTCKAPFGVEA